MDALLPETGSLSSPPDFECMTRGKSRSLIARELRNARVRFPLRSSAIRRRLILQRRLYTHVEDEFDLRIPLMTKVTSILR